MEFKLIKVDNNMSNEAYFSQTDFDSRSFLVSVMRGGGLTQEWMDQGHSIFSGSSSTKLGSDFDDLVMLHIAGKQLDQVLLVPPPSVLDKAGRRSGNAYKSWKKELDPGQMECSADQFFVYQTMMNSLLNNLHARAIVESTIATQVSVFFTLDGHMLKTRGDGQTENFWWDLKTTSSEWSDLHRSAARFGYYEQEWLYVESAKLCGYDHHRMPFVFVQTFAPYECKVFYLPEDLVAAAGRRLVEVIKEVGLRRKTGIYSMQDADDEIEELVVPDYYRKSVLENEEVFSG